MKRWDKTDGCDRWIAWPGWEHLRFAWLLSAANGAWFAIVYGGCDWLTAHRTLRVPIHLPAERSIPFVPAAVVIYTSIDLLFLAAPFILRERREFTALILSLALATFIGGLGFLLVPAQPEYGPHDDLGLWAVLFHLADSANLTFNMAPSLHVALSVCCVAAFSRHAPSRGKVLLWLWATAIALSTLLTHQHHLVDVFTGWLTGIFANRVTGRRAKSGDFSCRFRPRS